jgi:hypothetical protein
MKFRNFLGVNNTPQQAYFKEGVEALYPSTKSKLLLAILPAYDPDDPKPTSWLPAVEGAEENDFYTTVRAAKFVGHGNRRAKTSFISPRTFDLDADDPYDAFYDYCSRSDKWSYLTKDKRGRTLTGEVEGAVFPKMKNFFVANVMDVAAGSRGGIFVTELSESVAKNILYSLKKNGQRIDGLAFERDSNGKLVFGDITDPKSALVIEVVYNGKSYVARPVIDNGDVKRVEIPETLLQHRQHMEDPETFLIHPGDGQAIVDKLAGMLRGYKSACGADEIEALKEAMQFAYGDKYVVDEEAQEAPDDPFGDAAKTVSAAPAEKKEAVSEAVERGVEHERYTPVNPITNTAKSAKAKKIKAKPLILDDSKVVPMTAEPFRDEPAPGEDIDPSDIANVRAMLLGGK